MSAFNHMGKLVSVDDDWSTYEFYPDYFSHESIFGIFRIKPATLLIDADADAVEYEIVSIPKDVKLWFNRPMEHVVFALISKIKKSAKSGNLFPSEIYHNA